MRGLYGFGLLVSGFVLSVSGCVDTHRPDATERETVDTASPALRHDGTCGTVTGTFRARWWNYYERALSYAACAQWFAAEADLREALAQRSQDQRRARTYGMHFVDYFSHRELGIVLYRQGQLQAAIQELETSLGMEKSAKAEVYLDRVRTDWIQQNHLDRLPPVITIDSPKPDALLTGFSVRVQGTVRDDTFVNSVRVNGIALRIDLAAPQIPFSIEVPLGRDQNPIEVVATDLGGRTTTYRFRTATDREGPVLGIEQAEPGASLQGYIEDPSGLAEVKINDKPVPVPLRGPLRLNHPLPPAAVRPKLVIEAVDRAGNFTVAQLDFSEKFNRRPTIRIQLASVGSWTFIQGSSTGEPVLNYYSGIGSIYLDQVYLEGHVSLPSGVASMTINGIEMVRQPGRMIYFTHRIALQPGVNTLQWVARAQNGSAVTGTLNLTRVLQPLEERANRYPLALLGQPSVGDRLSPLLNAWQQSARFNPQPLPSPQAITQVNLAEAASQARAKGAEGVLLVEAATTASALEYTAQLVNARSDQPMLLVDAYQEGTVDAPRLAAQLFSKLAEQLPESTGRVRSVSGTLLTLDLEGAATLPVDLPLWVYRQPPPVHDDRTGANLGARQAILGQARLVQPAAAPPTAAVFPLQGATVQTGDLVKVR